MFLSRTDNMVISSKKHSELVRKLRAEKERLREMTEHGRSKKVIDKQKEIVQIAKAKIDKNQRKEDD